MLLPIGLALVYLGGWWLALTVTLIMALAASEFVGLFRQAALQPALPVVVGGAGLLALARQYDEFAGTSAMVTLLVLAAMAYHLVAFERGRNQAGTDFAITLAGIFYIGWLGAYFISLRGLPDGFFWVMTVLPAVWFADSFAYLVGVRFGRHKMTQRLSPKKSWEGYAGGIVGAIIGTALLAALYRLLLGAGPAITPLRGAIIGLVVSAVTILGDLGESMIKRQVGVKDSGTLLPGHGGMFDRIDSWLWAAPIGYYLITWFFLSKIYSLFL